MNAQLPFLAPLAVLFPPLSSFLSPPPSPQLLIMLKQSLLYIALSSFILTSCLALTSHSRPGFIRRLSSRDNASHSFTAHSLQHRTAQSSTCDTDEKAPFYSSLVAIGASFTDDGHPRFAKWNATLRQYYPYSLYEGKYTNGKIAVEYTVNSSTSPPLKHDKGKGIVLRDCEFRPFPPI